MKEVLARSQAWLFDTAMCLILRRWQEHSNDQVIQASDLEHYITQCRGLSFEEFYCKEPMEEMKETSRILQWRSPVDIGFPENATARVKLFCCKGGWQAPTVVFLHALMSASDFGYTRIAGRFNRRGWNAMLPHLPFHYSRVPHGHFNGALALTTNLPRNGEALRQAVKEIRQLMELCRMRGCRRFGLIATSYGGWIGALLSFVEADFEFIKLLQPIADIEQAIWESPVGGAIRERLVEAGIKKGISLQHAHLSSPLHGKPLLDPERISLIAGRYDRVVPIQTIKRLAEAWGGLSITVVPQGHFGYRAMSVALSDIFSKPSSTASFFTDPRVS